MKCSATFVFEVLITLIIVDTESSVDHVLFAETDTGCQQNCNLSEPQLVCTGCIPDKVPETVRGIVLDELSYDRLFADRFCHVSWKNVEALSIISQSVGNLTYEIADYAFNCLDKIESLKLSIASRPTFNTNTFSGLTNVRVLDFTKSIRLETAAITTGLSLETNIPKLSKIILTNVGSAYRGVLMSEGFVNVLARRNVSEINLSQSHVTAVNISTRKMCENLKVLNLSYTDIAPSSNLPCTVCSSLRVLDLSRAILPGTIIWKGNVTIQGQIEIDGSWTTIVSAVSRLFINKLVSNYIYIFNSTLRVNYNNSLTELHFSGYNIPVLELERITGVSHLQVLDLSDNGIEKLSPKILGSIRHLKIINLSHNRLYSSNRFHETFTNLFNNNLELKEANLASNGLTYLPVETFLSNTKIEQLDISENKMTQMNFKLEHLLQLKYADFRKNAVEYLNKFSMKQIDMLYKNKHGQRNKTTGNKTFVIDLRNNPFSCECSSLHFIKWFVDSPVFEESRGWYHCEIDGRHIPMNTEAIKAATEDCDKFRRKLLSIVLPSAGLGITVAFSVLLYARYLRRKRHKRFTNVIDRIHNESLGYRFPVFLSFASKDAEFVDFNVLRPLQAHLKALTDTDRDLVATGDRCFRLGRSIFQEIIHCLEESAAFVVLLSKNYCNSEYCQLEIEQARLMRKPIVIITKGIILEDEMNAAVKETFNHFTRATFRFDGENFKLQQDWEYISQCILRLL